MVDALVPAAEALTRADAPITAQRLPRPREPHALHQWVFCATRGSPGARNYYTTMRARGIAHQAAIRQLSNRLVGVVHGCLKTGSGYNEHTASDDNNDVADRQ